MTDEIINAPVPSRSTATFTVMFGMVPVPIRLFTPTQENETTKRKLYTQDDNPISRPNTDSVTGQVVPQDQCKKMVDVNGELVELSDDEIASITSGQAVDKGFVPIITLIPAETLNDRYKVSKWYQARPQMRQVGKKRQADPVANQAYSLFIQALQAENVAALVRVGIRSSARYGAIAPDGNFYFLHFDEEVRGEVDFPEGEVSDNELEMARKMLDQIGVGTPNLVDEAAAEIEKYVLAKAAGTATIPDAPQASEQSESLDLTSLLAASLK